MKYTVEKLTQLARKAGARSKKQIELFIRAHRQGRSVATVKETVAVKDLWKHLRLKESRIEELEKALAIAQRPLPVDALLDMSVMSVLRRNPGAIRLFHKGKYHSHRACELPECGARFWAEDGRDIRACSDAHEAKLRARDAEMASANAERSSLA